jgi:hypothetical protein
MHCGKSKAKQAPQPDHILIGDGSSQEPLVSEAAIFKNSDEEDAK